MKRYLGLILLLPIFLGANVITLDEMIQYGLEHNITLQKTELNTKNAESQLNSAKWNLVPGAALTGGVTKDFDPILAQNDLSSSVGFGLSKTISLNDASYFNYRYAKVDKDTADLRLMMGHSSYAYQVFSAYVEVLSSTKRKSALEENLAIQTRVWEQSKILLSLGKTTPFEVKQNEIAVMNSRISILQLENTISTARSKLFALVQMPDTKADLADLEIYPEKDLPPFSQDNILELKVLQQDMKRNELSSKQTQLNIFPEVSLGYNFSRKVGGADFDFDNYSTNHALNLNLSYSLWNHFTNKESRIRNKISKQITQLSMDDSIDQAKRDYDNSIAELQYLVRLNELYSEKLSQSREQIKIAEERYRLGMIQLLELDKTRIDYIDADIAYHANRYQIIQKQEAIEYLLSNKILGKW